MGRVRFPNLGYDIQRFQGREGGSSALIRNIVSAPLEYNFYIFCHDQPISKGPKSHKQREEVQIQGCNEHND